MATIFPTPAARQPFAPINASRLQNLTSLKNRQNALPTTLASPSKRKAIDYEEDFENIDPVILTSPKRSKGHDGSETFKSSQFVFTKAPTTFKDLSPVKASVSRQMLQPRSPATIKVNTSATTTTLSAPAGRSPTRKRIGILNRRRTAGASTFTRVNPPKFNVSNSTVSAAPFSIAAALSGTIPSYGARQASKTASHAQTSSLPEPEAKAGWFFDIHEDTIEETMTNLMEHSTCTLDISSDEETEQRRRDERGKENVPPLDDISQTSGRMTSLPSEAHDAKTRTKSARRRKEIEEGAIEIDRSPLGEMAAEEFWAEGCSDEDVVLVANEEDETSASEHTDVSTEATQDDVALVPEQYPLELSSTFDFSVDVPPPTTVDELMTLRSEDAAAKLFEPLEKAEEGWGIWESGSAKGDD